MNLFTAQGRLLYVRPPQEPGRSAIIMMATGVQKNVKEALIQTVNKSLIRLPGYMLKDIDLEKDLKINEIYEVYGHVNPLVKTKPNSKQEFLTTELLASGIVPLKATGDVKKSQLYHSLFNRWAGTGVIGDYLKAKKTTRPDILHMRVRRKVAEKEQFIQGSDRVAVAISPHLKERMIGLDIGDSIYIEGRMTGILRRVPTGVPDEFEQTVHNGIAAAHIRKLGAAPIWAFEKETPGDSEVTESEIDDVTTEAQKETKKEAGTEDNVVVVEEKQA